MATSVRLERAAQDGGGGSSQRPRIGPNGRPAILLITGIGVLCLVIGAGWLTGAFGEAIWWLTTTVPPSLALSGPTNVVRGSAPVEIQRAPRTRIVDAQVDDRPVSSEQPVMVDTTGLPDGSHRVRVTVEDSSLRRNRSQAELEIRSDNTPPHLILTPDQAAVPRGHTCIGSCG
jgi:hypothetical protein